jgi:hypothetical protein
MVARFGGSSWPLQPNFPNDWPHSGGSPQQRKIELGKLSGATIADGQEARFKLLTAKAGEGGYRCFSSHAREVVGRGL